MSGMVTSVILAGGSGTRLWPLSRAGNPKFLHDFTGAGRSLLQATYDRLEGISLPDRVYVVTGASHFEMVSAQLPQVPIANILIEPSPRDSCAAIGLAAAVIAQRSPGAIVGVFSADHLIDDHASFAKAVKRAASAAEAGYLATIGIPANRPEIQYGYLKLGDVLQDGVRKVVEFKEKPSQDAALRYVESGTHLWNAGMFVFCTRAFLGELAQQQPGLHDGVLRIARMWDTPNQAAILAETWPTLPKISVDYAVMEAAAAAGRVATVLGEFGWTDIGDFHSLADSVSHDADSNVLIGQQEGLLVRDVKHSTVISSSDRAIVVLGLDNVIIVDTADAVLVCSSESAQEVKEAVQALRASGGERYI